MKTALPALGGFAASSFPPARFIFCRVRSYYPPPPHHQHTTFASTVIFLFLGHYSGFLDEVGSAAAWYLQGKLSSDATMVDVEAAEWQQQQQQQLRTTRNVAGGSAAAVLNSGAELAAQAAQAAQADGSDAVGRFLQRLADASGTPSSILGGLPEDDDGLPPRVEARISSTLPRLAEAVAAEEAAAATARQAPLRGDDGTDWRGPPLDGGMTSRLSEGAAIGVGATSEGLEGTGRQKERAKAGRRSVREVQGPRVPERPEPPHLVLFARAKGRPFVYCGAVDCVDQEYVWSASSSRLGAVRLTLALREWREVAGSGAGRTGTADGIDDAFAEVVREGFK